MKKIVLAALSGGVDSAFAAHLKVQEGYKVIGVTLDFFGKKDFKEAERIANFLNIGWYVADYKKEFQDSVISYFIKTYIDGKTPNPCAFCNRFAKFPYLYKEMVRNKAEVIITGHYAGIDHVNEEKYIAIPKDAKKDQTYYLSLLSREILNYVEFPLSKYLKTEIRAIAKDISLPSAETKDSQEVCFLQGKDYRDFLEVMVNKKKYRKGKFVLNGQIVGEHRGILFYTVGQRKGLGLKHHKSLYVAKIDSSNNNIILKEGEPYLSRGVKLNDCNFFDDSTKIETIYVMLRYRMKKAKALLERLPFSKANLLFEEPQASATPGQIAAIYREDKLIGGGFIGEVF